VHRVSCRSVICSTQTELSLIRAFVTDSYICAIPLSTSSSIRGWKWRLGQSTFCWQRAYHHPQQINVPKMLRGTGGEMHVSPQSMGLPSSNRADIKLPTTPRKNLCITARTLPDFLRVTRRKNLAGHLAHGVHECTRESRIKGQGTKFPVICWSRPDFRCGALADGFWVEFGSSSSEDKAWRAFK